MKRIIFLLSLVFCGMAFANDYEEGSPERTLFEELALLRDAYMLSINTAMDDANSESSTGWFDLRAEGKAATWAELEFEVPAGLPHLTVEEKLYGFKVTSKTSAFPGSATVKVVTRDADIYYDIAFSGASADFKKMFKEVFYNGRVVFYNNATSCKREAVTCIKEFTVGTKGRLK